MAPSTRITYWTSDPKRQVIPYVRVESRGQVKEFGVAGVTPAQLATWERRTMDCMDCHNRPSHRFDPAPEAAVDDALANGAIARTLPFARREAVAALKAAYPSQEAAIEAIRRRLTNFYRGELKEQFAAREPDVARAVATVEGIYQRNVFPAMKVTWGTYANNLGHTQFPGCFRCHDDAHQAKDGSTIRQDCELCHSQE
jgi:hypothetical protein